MNFLTKTLAKIENFKKELLPSYSIKVGNYFKEIDFKNVLKSFFITLFNIIFTGILLYYSINNQNFLAYGIISYLAKEYISWFIDKIKDKPIKED
jgi:hypothetical protein